MELSTEDKAILAHIIIDFDAWVKHALATVGEWAVIAKIKKYRTTYLFQKDLPDYKNRSERDTIAEVAKQPTLEQRLEQEKEIKIQAKIRALAIESLKASGELSSDYK